MTARNHDDAVIDVEVKRLVNALSRYGVLHRDALERESGAKSWHQASFAHALRVGVDQGKLERLPFDFYRLSHREEAAEHSRAVAREGREAG